MPVFLRIDFGCIDASPSLFCFWTAAALKRLGFGEGGSDTPRALLIANVASAAGGVSRLDDSASIRFSLPATTTFRSRRGWDSGGAIERFLALRPRFVAILRSTS